MQYHKGVVMRKKGGKKAAEPEMFAAIPLSYIA
jgi:hypothetical protein